MRIEAKGRGDSPIWEIAKLLELEDQDAVPTTSAETTQLSLELSWALSSSSSELVPRALPSSSLALELIR